MLEAFVVKGTDYYVVVMICAGSGVVIISVMFCR